MPSLTQEQRIAAEKNIRETLGVRMMGSYPKTDGRDGPVGSDAMQKTEAEILGVQMYAFGEVWSRPILDLKTRTFITVAVLAALNYPDQLAEYVRGALKLGITPEDILETMLQMGVYGGLAAANGGLDVARDVFVEEGLRNPGAGAHLEPAFPMDTQGRMDAMKRVTTYLGTGRLGLEANAAPLAWLKTGPWSIAAIDLPIEKDINYTSGEYGYGEIWGRPALGYRLRSFITMATLQAMLENDQFHYHVNNALNIGITPDEIHEAMSHVGLYHGTSGWRNAANVARDVFLQRGIVKPAA